MVKMNRCFLDLKFHSGSIGDLYLSPKCSPDRVLHKSKRLHVHHSWNYPTLQCLSPIRYTCGALLKLQIRGIVGFSFSAAVSCM